MKKTVTQEQKDLLDKIDKELEGGARDVYQAMLKQLEGQLAVQNLERSCKTTESITQLVNYDSSFDGRDNELGLTHHNLNITDANLKAPDVLKPFELGSATREFKVYRPNRRISSEKVIALMKKNGYRPATALESLEYYVAQLRASQITSWFILVALGAVWQGGVVSLHLDPTNRGLSLSAFDGVWHEGCEFLAVRES